MTYDCLRSSLLRRTMCARQLRSRHFQYKEHIVQATMDRFDGILSLPLFATPAFTDMQPGLI